MFAEAFGDVFQVAYVTHDRGAAEGDLEARLGISDWTDLEVEPAGASLAVAFARAGRIQVELIQPLGGRDRIFSELLPSTGAVRMHHLGVRVEDMDEALEHADAAGFRAPHVGEIEGQLKFAFVDTTAELGHYLELAQFTPAGWDFVAGILEARA